ncbi:MAG: hypothetical protein ACKO3W_06725 [bacterium]
MRNALMFVAAMTVASVAQAQVTLDGVADKSYGAAIVVSNTQTGFGDSNLGAIDYANGSELNGAFAKIEDGFLYLMLAGNLESNYNKLEIFLDAVDGGQNQLRGDNLDVDFNGLNRMGDNLGTTKVVEGLTFDAGFSADLWIGLTCGGSPFAVYFNYATLPTGGAGTGGYQGNGGAGAAGATTFKSGFGFGLDNSNTAGVAGGCDVGDGAGANKGIEVRIPLSAIPGYTEGDIKVCAFINGGGHDYLSNQVLAPLGGGCNLAEPRLVNFENVPGTQYFVVANSGGSNCPSDIDGNGSVDAADLSSLLGNWGGAGTGDIDGNGTVDAADLSTLLGAWGPCAG